MQGQTGHLQDEPMLWVHGHGLRLADAIIRQVEELDAMHEPTKLGRQSLCVSEQRVGSVQIPSLQRHRPDKVS